MANSWNALYNQIPQGLEQTNIRKCLKLISNFFHSWIAFCILKVFFWHKKTVKSVAQVKAQHTQYFSSPILTHTPPMQLQQQSAHCILWGGGSSYRGLLMVKELSSLPWGKPPLLKWVSSDPTLLSHTPLQGRPYSSPRPGTPRIPVTLVRGNLTSCWRRAATSR